ncbi:MAG: cobalt transporter CbiM [Ignavibacteria bacterium]|nr:cobalt transporter CbiM [Ignavibacteria bacterium]
MHIPDGYLSPQTYIPLYGIMLPFWGIALKKIKKILTSEYIAYIAMSAVFSFLIMLFNIPIPGGTTGHAVGAAVITIILGPWVAVISISVVLIIQALLFADGGITALGANCFNMAVIMPFASYFIFKIINSTSKSKLRIQVSSFLAGYIGLLLAAIATAIQLGIQPLVAHAEDGTPLYSPYPLEIAIPVMALEHLIIFSVVEGLITMAIVSYFLKYEPESIYCLKGNN